MAMSQTKVTAGADLILSLVIATRETCPGLYHRIARFDREGTYTLNIANAEKPLAQFTLDVVPTKNVKPWIVEPILPAQPYIAGQQAIVQFRVTSTQPGAAQITDGVITIYRFAPGQAAWQRMLTFNSFQNGLTVADSPRATAQVIAR